MKPKPLVELNLTWESETQGGAQQPLLLVVRHTTAVIQLETCRRAQAAEREELSSTT